ncbi:hypothetical protein FEP90_05465 [Burkholderia multivorans]|nr:hypothetical protein [Burkholderia multivorans]
MTGRRHRPRVGRTHVDRMIEGQPHVVEHDLVAAGRAQAEMIPAFDHADPCVVHVRIAPDEEHADTRLRFVGARPHGQPAQRRNAGAVQLVTGQPPAVAVATRDRIGQPAARRRTERRLDAQRVDQCAVGDRAVEHRAPHLRGPAVVGPAERAVLQICHRQDERGGRVGACDGRDDPARARERRAGAAKLARHHLRDQPRALQPREILVRKTALDIVARGIGREFGHETVEQRGEARLVVGQAAQRRLARRQRSGKADGHRYGFSR